MWPHRHLLETSCSAVKCILSKTSLNTCRSLVLGVLKHRPISFYSSEEYPAAVCHWSDLLNSGVTSDDQGLFMGRLVFIKQTQLHTSLHFTDSCTVCTAFFFFFWISHSHPFFAGKIVNGATRNPGYGSFCYTGLL